MLGVFCLLVAGVYLAVEILTLRSLPRGIFALLCAAALAGNGICLAFPERIPASWDRSLEDRPWLLVTLVMLAILVPTVLFVLVLVTEYRP